MSMLAVSVYDGASHDVRGQCGPLKCEEVLKHALAINQQNELQWVPAHAKREGAQRITHINLAVGKLSGLMNKGTLAQGMRLTFEWRPVEAFSLRRNPRQSGFED
jgi:hypothetical protein